MSQPLEGTSSPNVYQPSNPLRDNPSTIVLVPNPPKTPAEQLELLTNVFKGLPDEGIEEVIKIATNRQPFFEE